MYEGSDSPIPRPGIRHLAALTAVTCLIVALRNANTDWDTMPDLERYYFAASHVVMGLIFGIAACIAFAGMWLRKRRHTPWRKSPGVVLATCVTALAVSAGVATLLAKQMALHDRFPGTSHESMHFQTLNIGLATIVLIVFGWVLESNLWWQAVLFLPAISTHILSFLRDSVFYMGDFFFVTKLFAKVELMTVIVTSVVAIIAIYTDRRAGIQRDWLDRYGSGVLFAGCLACGCEAAYHLVT